YRLNRHDHSEPDTLRPGSPEGNGFRSERGIGHAESTVDRQQHQNSAEPPHPRDRWTESDDEDRLENSGRYRVVPDRRGDRTGELTGEHAVPVPGRGRQYRDDAHRALRPRRNAEHQHYGFS